MWFTSTDAIAEPSKIAAYCKMLSVEEFRRAMSFRFSADRNTFLFSRALIRTTLSQFADVAPEDWTFEFNSQGKPAVAACHGEARHLTFNLSHTRGMILLALGWRRELGIDVETTNQKIELSIAEQVFSPSEMASFRQLDISDQLERFVDLWTLKESYIKACGSGLSMSLNRFGFDVDKAKHIGFTVAAGIDDCPDRWHFLQFDLMRSLRVALCIEHFDQEITFRLLESVPLYVKRPKAWPAIRRSTESFMRKISFS